MSALAAVVLLLICSNHGSCAKPKLTLDEFFEYTEFGSLILSPTDGRSVLIRTRHHLWERSTNEYHLHLHSLVDQSKKRVTRNASGSLQPLWHNQWIAYAIEHPTTDGQYYLEFYSPRTEQRFSMAIGKEPIHAWSWSNEVTSLYFATRTPWNRASEESYGIEWKDVIEYREQGRGDTIYRLTFDETGRFEMNIVTNSSLRVAELLCSSDGNYLVFSTEANSQRIERMDEYELYTLDLHDPSVARSPTRLTNNQAIERDLKWMNGSIFFTVSGEGSVEGDYKDSQGRLYALNISTGDIQRWTSAFNGSVKAFAFLEQGHEGVILLGQSRTEVQVYSQETASSPLRQRSSWPGSYELISTAGSTLLFLHSSFGVPQEVYFADNIDRLDQAQPVTKENKLFTERNLPRGRTYHWSNVQDGTEIEGILLYPPDRFEAKNLPLLVLIHGGPYNYADLNVFHADWYDCAVMMATDGWLVFQPNYRGSGGRPRPRY